MLIILRIHNLYTIITLEYFTEVISNSSFLGLSIVST